MRRTRMYARLPRSLFDHDLSNAENDKQGGRGSTDDPERVSPELGGGGNKHILQCDEDLVPVIRSLLVYRICLLW